MNIATKIALLAVFSGPALAASDSDFGKCTAITSDADRLICFDATAKKAKEQLAVTENVSPKSESLESSGAWEVSSDADPMTDKLKYFAGLPATKGDGHFGKPVLFAAACVDNKTSVFVMWNYLLGIGFKPEVTYRLDKATPVKASWNMGNDNQTTFQPGSSVQFLKQLIDSKSLVLSTTTYSGATRTAVFDITGAGEAFKTIRENCKW